MMKAIIPKKTIAPIRHVAAVPIMIRLRTALLSKSLPPTKARNSRIALIPTAMSINLTMPGCSHALAGYRDRYDREKSQLRGNEVAVYSSNRRTV